MTPCTHRRTRISFPQWRRVTLVNMCPILPARSFKTEVNSGCLYCCNQLRGETTMTPHAAFVPFKRNEEFLYTIEGQSSKTKHFVLTQAVVKELSSTIWSKHHGSFFLLIFCWWQRVMKFGTQPWKDMFEESLKRKDWSRNKSELDREVWSCACVICVWVCVLLLEVNRLTQSASCCLVSWRISGCYIMRLITCVSEQDYIAS